jgi:hypothetical protein
MHPDDQHDPADRGRASRAGRFQLFYFEKIGSSRTYLRFTRLTLFLIVGLIVLSILLLFALFLSKGRGCPEDIDVNVVAPTATPYDYNKPVLRRATPGPTPPKVIKQPSAGVPPSPSPTPSPAPTRTPP